MLVIQLLNVNIIESSGIDKAAKFDESLTIVVAAIRSRDHYLILKMSNNSSDHQY